MKTTKSLPRTTMSVALAVSQASHLLSRPVTPVPLTQLPQRKPVVERGPEIEAAQASIMYIQQKHNGTYIHIKVRYRAPYTDLT